MREKLRDIVFRAIKTQELLLDSTVDRSLGDEAPLYGGGGPFDSMALVSFIAHIEELVDTEMQTSITLVSEKAMSARRSPFATIGSLVDFIDETLLVSKHD